jgi:hypothetical protein
VSGSDPFTTVGDPNAWTPSRRETIHLLEGQMMTIEIRGGRRSSSSPTTWPLCRRLETNLAHNAAVSG